MNERNKTMSKKVHISVNGCDDSTQLTLTVTADELKLLKRLERVTEKFGGGCQPVIEVRTTPARYTKYENGDDDE